MWSGLVAEYVEYAPINKKPRCYCSTHLLFSLHTGTVICGLTFSYHHFCK